MSFSALHYLQIPVTYAELDRKFKFRKTRGFMHVHGLAPMGT
jgi:hypothetical protein